MKFILSPILASLTFGAMSALAFSPTSTFQKLSPPSSTAAKAFFSDSYTSPRFDEPEPEIDPRRKTPDEKPAAPPVRMPVIDMGDGKQMDVISRLLKDRILLLGQGVDDEVANVLVVNNYTR